MKQWDLDNLRTLGLLKRASQQGTISTGAAGTTATVALLTVDLANTLLFDLGFTEGDVVNAYGGVGLKTYASKLKFTDASTLQIDRNFASPNNAVVKSYVIAEFWPGVFQSIEYGEITISGANASATLSLAKAIDPLRAWVLPLGFVIDADATAHPAQIWPKLVITDSVTITASLIENINTIAAASAMTIGCCVVNPH